MSLRLFVFILLCHLSIPWASAQDFKGLAWLEKNRDKDGCILLIKLVEDEKNGECPKEFEPQIRPMTIGKLDVAKTQSQRKKSGKEICCFEWKTYGNR